MFGKASLILLTVFATLLCCGIAAAQSPDDPERSAATDKTGSGSVENLSKTVEALQTAYNEKDLEKITGFFPVDTIDEIGGHDNFVRYLGLGESAAPETATTFGEPNELHFFDGKWFSVVSFRMEWNVPKGRRVVETCLVAVSNDDGNTWRFYTGEGFFKGYPELVGRFQVIDRKETTERIVQ